MSAGNGKLRVNNKINQGSKRFSLLQHVNLTSKEKKEKENKEREARQRMGF